MKDIFIREERGQYRLRIAAFVFVIAVAAAVWRILEVRGMEIFLAVGVLGLLQSIYMYLSPKKLLYLSPKGLRNLETHMTVAWTEINRVTAVPFREGEYERPNLRHVVVCGYSRRAGEEVEWFRIGIAAEEAAQAVQTIETYRNHILAKGQSA